FLIADGVLPSNEGRGYVLRRIIRRAIRHGHNLGVSEVLFYRLVAALVKEMGEAYPVLAENRAPVEKTLRIEEEQILHPLDQVLRLLESEIEQLKGDTLSVEVIINLYDPYRSPADLTADMAHVSHMKTDM